MPGKNDYSQDDLDNKSNQMNPNHDSYWQSRGDDERPNNWDEKSKNERDDDKKDRN